jgi:hypothetical protein
LCGIRKEFFYKITEDKMFDLMQFEWKTQHRIIWGSIRKSKRLNISKLCLIAR